MLLLLVLFACAPLDDEACLDVDTDAECPSDDAAATALEGTDTCEVPVREVTRTGAFVERVVGKTGDQCCYEAHYRTRNGESCLTEDVTP